LAYAGHSGADSAIVTCDRRCNPRALSHPEPTLDAMSSLPLLDSAPPLEAALSATANRGAQILSDAEIANVMERNNTYGVTKKSALAAEGIADGKFGLR
jgi:hypothetical protein